MDQCVAMEKGADDRFVRVVTQCKGCVEALDAYMYVC